MTQHSLLVDHSQSNAPTLQDTVIFMTHIGPFSSTTTIAQKDLSVAPIYSGSKGLDDLLRLPSSVCSFARSDPPLFTDLHDDHAAKKRSSLGPWSHTRLYRNVSCGEHLYCESWTHKVRISSTFPLLSSSRLLFLIVLRLSPLFNPQRSGRFALITLQKNAEQGRWKVAATEFHRLS